MIPSRLKAWPSRPAPGHFPQYNEEFFKQLTAERLVTRMVKRFPRGSWEKEPGRRNEGVGLSGLCPGRGRHLRLDRFGERHWRRMEKALARVPDDEHEERASERLSARPPARQMIQSGYMAR